MRYFIEVAYVGYNYSGFQKQNNAVTIQGKIEHAMQLVLKHEFELTCSSRTDAQVNAYQNYFHFDFELEIDPRIIYNLNAILPVDIVVKAIMKVADEAHSRFDATARKYTYILSLDKNPFTSNKAYFYPFQLNFDLLQQCAALFKANTTYQAYSKKHTQVFTFNCTIFDCSWIKRGNSLIFTVEANRFLRGMVKAMVGTSLQVALGKMTIQEFEHTFTELENTNINFTPPGYALYLRKVKYPVGYFEP